MEFVVIESGSQQRAEQVANRLRARGYQHFSPALFFMDDFGDSRPQDDKWPEAEDWCCQHVLSELKHHHDVVLNGVTPEPELYQAARDEGYHLVRLQLDNTVEPVLDQKLNELISAHQLHAEPWLQRWFGNIHS